MLDKCEDLSVIPSTYAENLGTVSHISNPNSREVETDVSIPEPARLISVRTPDLVRDPVWIR